MKVEIETVVPASIEKVWQAWNSPADIKAWNAASSDWHCPESQVDLRVGGRFTSRMEARDGSAGFDFAGTYMKVVPHQVIEYTMDDDRAVVVKFNSDPERVTIRIAFDAESSNPVEMQRQGWQAILDNFSKYVQAKA